MVRDHFAYRKSEQLKKGDKSLKQSWDLRINKLCEKINNSDDYYTTSSCSGRVVILKDFLEKLSDLFIFVSHDEISFEKLKLILEKLEGDDLIYFKQDPVIIHVACRSLEDAQKLIDLASREAGWKRCGIIGSDKRFVVELNTTEKLEFPIFQNGKILVDDDYLKLIVLEANKKLNQCWNKIERLEKLII